MIDQDRFHALLTKAIGDKSQKDFAEKAGLSKFTLNRYVTQNITAAPRVSTLQRIANASDGKVSLYDLLHAVGLHDLAAEYEETGAVQNTDPLAISEEYRKKAADLKKNILTYIAKPYKDTTIVEWFDLFKMLYEDSDCNMEIGEEKEIPPCKSKSLSGSDYYAPITAVWTNDVTLEKIKMVFIVCYCKTTGNSFNPSTGVIVCDAVFDLQKLIELKVEGLNTLIQIVFGKDDASLSDYPLAIRKL